MEHQVKGHRIHVVRFKIHQRLHQRQVPRGGNGQKLCQSLYRAQ